MAKTLTGLLAHQASLDPQFVHTAQRLIDHDYDLKVLFAPQHGYAGYTQANMIEVDHSRVTIAGRELPLYSLYGEVRKPTAEMLKGLELMVIDLQDVGARGYTYVWTMLYMLEACGEQGIKVLIIDRPNPIAGEAIEGPLLEKSHFSFVGMHQIPIRHGMTIGELALLMKQEKDLPVDLEVQALDGWQRSYYFDETGLPWIMPSPNIPTLSTALVYPGMELLEGTNLSEGRGTTRPFELFGAPYVDAETLCQSLNRYQLPGVYFRPVAFEPTFDKWQGELCQGAQIHLTDVVEYCPVSTAVTILAEVIRRYEPFEFLQPPYEYETEKPPFDILAGDDRLRIQLMQGKEPVEIASGWLEGCEAFAKRRQNFLLYD